MTKKDLVEVAKKMIESPSCCPELYAAGQAWIDSIGKADEKSKAESLIAEIKEDVNDIDSLTAFANSPLAEKIFGENVENFRKHTAELKASGAKYCDCGACQNALKILENKSVILN